MNENINNNSNSNKSNNSDGSTCKTEDTTNLSPIQMITNHLSRTNGSLKAGSPSLLSSAPRITTPSKKLTTIETLRSNNVNNANNVYSNNNNDKDGRKLVNEGEFNNLSPIQMLTKANTRIGLETNGSSLSTTSLTAAATTSASPPKSSPSQSSTPCKQSLEDNKISHTIVAAGVGNDTNENINSSSPTSSGHVAAESVTSAKVKVALKETFNALPPTPTVISNIFTAANNNNANSNHGRGMASKSSKLSLSSSSSSSTSSVSSASSLLSSKPLGSHDKHKDSYVKPVDDMLCQALCDSKVTMGEFYSTIGVPFT
eukprot:Awhi_evm1s6600